VSDGVGRCLRVFFLVALVLSRTRSARAVELWANEQGGRGDLDVAGKLTSLASEAPSDPILYPQRWSRTTLARLRLGLDVQHNDWMDSQLAYEQRARWPSGAGGLGATSSSLPAEAAAPFRITQLDWEIAADDSLIWRQEIDRGLVSLHPEWGEVTIGRQAIGLGRGVLFGAVDVFAPFSPLEVDREWRRGVDAFRAEYRLSTTTSAEVISAFGPTWEQSALLGRLRGYVGDVDGSLIFGKRAEDTMLGTAVSTIVKDAEVHGEVAVFDTPEEQPDGGFGGNEHLAVKTVLGASYTFDVGNGLTLLVEHHYSGFGVEDARDALMRLQDKDFRDRLLRGDMQILGRQAMAGRISYPFNDIASGSFLVLTSPTDGSGVFSPSLRVDLNRNMTFLASAFVPWGSGPSDGQLQSEYGATPTSLFLQMAVYY
jgi:hypothetical protein